MDSVSRVEEADGYLTFGSKYKTQRQELELPISFSKASLILKSNLALIV